MFGLHHQQFLTIFQNAKFILEHLSVQMILNLIFHLILARKHLKMYKNYYIKIWATRMLLSSMDVKLGSPIGVSKTWSYHSSWTM